MKNKGFPRYKQQKKLENHRTKLSPAEEALLAWKRGRGYLDGHMLTLSPPPGNRNKSVQWLQNAWREAYRHYGRYFNEKLYFSTVITRGEHGDMPPSMHVVWQQYPKHLGYLVGWLQARYVTAVTKPHENGLTYWAKNCGEPDAVVEVGQWQLSQEKVRKRAKSRKTRVI